MKNLRSPFSQKPMPPESTAMLLVFPPFIFASI